MHDLDELTEIARDHFWCFGRTLPEVVISFVDDHRARVVGDDAGDPGVLIEVRKTANRQSLD